MALPSKTRLSPLIAAGLTAGLLVLTLAGCTSEEEETVEYYVSPPISNEISGEAREHCLDNGFTLDEIAADVDACLLEYWTYDRLLRSERLKIDWYAENNFPVPCSERKPRADGKPRVCNLGYVVPPDLPDEDDPWWDEQATRDPGRTTMPGLGQDIQENTRTPEQIKRDEAFRSWRQSDTPVPISELSDEDEEFYREWCTQEPSAPGYAKETRAYSEEEIEVDVRGCLNDEHNDRY